MADPATRRSDDSVSLGGKRERDDEERPAVVSETSYSPDAGSAAAMPLSATAEEFEMTHVHSVYQQIASHFSATRYRPWPRVAAFVAGVPPGSIVVDMGCGNGKNIPSSGRPPPESAADGRKDDKNRPPVATSWFVGCDRSSALLNDARAGRIALGAPLAGDVLQCDNLMPALREGIADAVLSIAVIHHMSTHARRVAAVRALFRLLRPGGALLIYVWAMEQEKRKGTAPVTVPTAVAAAAADSCVAGGAAAPPPPATHRREDTVGVAGPGDVMIDWAVHAKFDPSTPTLQRYYHLFSKGELESLCREALNGQLAAMPTSTAGEVAACVADLNPAKLATLEESYFDKENWCVVIRKRC